MACSWWRSVAVAQCLWRAVADVYWLAFSGSRAVSLACSDWRAVAVVQCLWRAVSLACSGWRALTGVQWQASSVSGMQWLACSGCVQSLTCSRWHAVTGAQWLHAVADVQSLVRSDWRAVAACSRWRAASCCREMSWRWLQLVHRQPTPCSWCIDSPPPAKISSPCPPYPGLTA